MPAARAGSEGGGVLASPAGTATAGTASEGLLPGAWRQVGLALGLAVAVGAVIGAVYGPQALGEFVNVYLVEQVPFPLSSITSALPQPHPSKCSLHARQ